MKVAGGRAWSRAGSAPTSPPKTVYPVSSAPKVAAPLPARSQRPWWLWRPAKRDAAGRLRGSALATWVKLAIALQLVSFVWALSGGSSGDAVADYVARGVCSARPTPWACEPGGHPYQIVEQILFGNGPHP